MSNDVIVVGAGFGGMYMLHRLRQSGFSTQVIEAGDNVGGMVLEPLPRRALRR